jgi:hypothetical protein
MVLGNMSQDFLEILKKLCLRRALIKNSSGKILFGGIRGTNLKDARSQKTIEMGVIASVDWF